MTDYAYLGCPVASVDADTGACLVPAVAVQPPQASFVPALSIADGAAISLAICACWLVGFGVSQIRRLLGSV